ncbi:hypothetical protein A3K93_03890 [Acinetobacter sp. NCu2D-2]|uniref:hypothetical protein n=1 Tax=Acinetobacter sp. NCu2D-2 TaxID=1608473 RepID=UPI0007CDEF85|nr:hypothetical protein [Acinetobacter sp. NCu2D-2]ANF81418.1 hypothetical protein A3K93_03890 [Acinetobacter sp. NCu2D-2]
MTDMNDYDDVEDAGVDDDEAQAAEKGASDSEESLSNTDIAEAETLTVTAKLKKRQALEDEVAAFLARGGRITEVPADESVRD